MNVVIDRIALVKKALQDQAFRADWISHLESSGSYNAVITETYTLKRHLYHIIEELDQIAPPSKEVK